MDPATLTRTVAGVVVLTGVATGVLVATRAPRPWASALAILRGVVQLALLSVVLSGVIRDPRWVGLALLTMFGVAVGVSSRRVGGRARVAVVAGAMGAGVLAVLLVVLGIGALEATSRYALAIGGIVIGNAMTIATIAGRRFLEGVRDRWDEVEAWLAIGATPREATRDIGRAALSAALIPSVDQTRTTGLVTLPGAFVGAIFGGVSPLEAGRFQVVVLAAILCAGAITAAALIGALRPVRTRPGGSFVV